MMLEIALDCLRRGWYVFPCKPASKEPMTSHAHKDASNDEDQIRAWWTKTPNANVAVAPGKSGITSLDMDTGLKSEEDLRAFCAAHDIPETLAVRTGKRPQYRVQLIFSGNVESCNGWQDGNHAGDLRGTWGYFMAPGCIHPESEEAYTVLWDKPLAPVPGWVRTLRAARKEREIDPNAPIVEWRNDTLYRVLCKHRANGADDEMLRDYALRAVARMPNPLDEEELETVIRNACKQPVGLPEPVAVLGTPKEPEPPRDWRTRYLTQDRVRNAPPVEYIIRGFLAVGSITVLAAPVAQRKSLIAGNVAHSALTGLPLFGCPDFAVEHRPSRVIYLCPEMGLSSFSVRLKSLGLVDLVGESLFCQTMNDDSTPLDDLDGELPGALVIIDTITRFITGNENSSEDMRKFSASITRLIQAGAMAVLVLHHSIKGAGNAELTLDAAMRGSTELAAAVTCVWATKLINPDEPHKSPSLLKNVKQRDFESKPFEIKSNGPDDYLLRMNGSPGTLTEIRNAKDAAAEAVYAAMLKDNPGLGVNKAVEMLKAAGHGRGAKWVREARARILETGVTVTAE